MYKLLLVGSFTQHSYRTSCEFFSRELAARFSVLSHVDFETYFFSDDMSKVPKSDIILVHSYHDTKAVLDIEKLKQRARKVVYFMEIVNPVFDHCYHYSKSYFTSQGRETFVKVPVVKNYYNVVEKDPGSILLDHKFQGPDWTERIYSFFVENRDKYPNVWQLDRPEFPSNRPYFIKPIKVDDPLSYLKATDRFERFVCTHYGSYNHSAVDMAVRGTHVVAPFDKESFVPQCNVEDLEIDLFHNEDQLNNLLNKPFEYRPKINNATDLDQVVALMDRDFKNWSSK